MNKKDAIIQAHFPTVMAPKYGELEPCEIGKTRLLMARDGLYIETRQPWGELRHRLWKAPRPLPYGEIEEVDRFAKAFRRIPEDLLDCMIEEAEIWAEQFKEWAGWIVFRDGQFRYQPLEFEYQAETAVKYKLPQLQDGEHLMLDLHSHGSMNPFFSSTDDRDDVGGVRICAVLGKYNGPGSFEAIFRYSVEGFFIDRGYDL